MGKSIGLASITVLLAVVGLVAGGGEFAKAQCASPLTFPGENGGDRFGRAVSGVGDVNGDGYDDIIAGASDNGIGGPGAGRAYVYSGLTGAALYVYTGEAENDNLGWSVSGAGDIDGDGTPDFIIGTRNAGGTGKAFVYSGADGSELYTFVGADPGFHRHDAQRPSCVAAPGCPHRGTPTDTSVRNRNANMRIALGYIRAW